MAARSSPLRCSIRRRAEEPASPPSLPPSVESSPLEAIRFASSSSLLEDLMSAAGPQEYQPCGRPDSAPRRARDAPSSAGPMFHVRSTTHAATRRSAGRPLERTLPLVAHVNLGRALLDRGLPLFSTPRYLSLSEPFGWPSFARSLSVSKTRNQCIREASIAPSTSDTASRAARAVMVCFSAIMAPDLSVR